MKMRFFVLCLLATQWVFCGDGVAETPDNFGVRRADIRMEPFWQENGIYLHLRQIPQGENLCGPTSAAIVLRYYGVDFDPKRIRVLVKDADTGKGKLDYFSGFYLEEIQSVLKPMGFDWSVQEFKDDRDGFREGMVQIKRELSRGHPVIAEVFLSEAGHGFVIDGYDDMAQVIHIVDPGILAPGLRMMTCQEFEKVWNRRDCGYPRRRAMFTRPKGEKEQVLVMPADLASAPVVTAEKRSVEKIENFDDILTGDFWVKDSLLHLSERDQPKTTEERDAERAKKEKERAVKATKHPLEKAEHRTSNIQDGARGDARPPG